MNAHPEQARVARALNATPAEHDALAALAVELGAPTRCPRCDGAMGDGDRVMHGRCSRCHRYLTGRTR